MLCEYGKLWVRAVEMDHLRSACEVRSINRMRNVDVDVVDPGSHREPSGP